MPRGHGTSMRWQPGRHVLRHSLPVGFFADIHHPPRTVEIEGEQLGAVVRLHVVQGPEGREVPVSEHLVLYHCPGGKPYVVHNVMERPDQAPTKLGLVARSLSWSELAKNYPSLARRALEVSRERALHPESPTDRIEASDLDDASRAFG